MLYGIEIPASGSETHFRSSVAFYEALPVKLRDRLDRVRHQHFYDHVKLARREYRDWDTDPTPGSPADVKPWVWEDPATGQRALPQSKSTPDFVGIDCDEGIALYPELTASRRHDPDLSPSLVRRRFARRARAITVR